MVCGNCSNRVYNPCVIAKAVNLFSDAVNPEFAVGFDQGCSSEVKGTHAVMDNICL
jgi:hypothetical protein